MIVESKTKKEKQVNGKKQAKDHNRHFFGEDTQMDGH